MTAEEFWDFWIRDGAEDARYELDRGEVQIIPLAGLLHGVICAWCCRLLGNYLMERRNGFACAGNVPLLVARNPDSVFGPDIMVFSVSKSLDQLEQTFCTNIPTLIVEVQDVVDRPDKTSQRAQHYLQCGVPMVWVVDPEHQTVTVQTLNQNAVVLKGADSITGEDVLPDLNFRVAEFFQFPNQPTQADPS